MPVKRTGKITYRLIKMNRTNATTVTLVTKTDIREIALPESYADLLASVSLARPGELSCVKYKTGAGVMQLMRSDEDLKKALELSSVNFVVSSDEEIESFPSTPELQSEEEVWAMEPECEELAKEVVKAEMELQGINILPVHERVTCDGCMQCPIQGIRYKCAVCPNFDFCAGCWQKNDHLHTFYAIKNPYDCSHAELIATDAHTCSAAWKATEKVLNPQKLKLKYLREGQLPERDTVFCGNQVHKTWFVRNSGQRQWPSGCVLTVIRGSLQVDTALVPPLQPGEQREIGVHFQVPAQVGLFSYAFRATESDGHPFGEKLHMTIRVEQA